MPPIATALLLSWRRPANLKLSIAAIREQSAETAIFLWTNCSEDDTSYDVDLHIRASANLMCLPRWFMAAYAVSEFVFSLDDDVLLADANVVRDCADYAAANACALGSHGVRGIPRRDYWGSRHVLAGGEDQTVDILKGRFIFTRRSSLAGMPMLPPLPAGLAAPRVEDDILVSSCLSKKVVPAFLRGRLLDLPEGPDSLWRAPGHHHSRVASCRHLFPQL